MSPRALSILVIGLGLVAILATMSPWYAAGLTVEPDAITVQIIANPPP